MKDERGAVLAQVLVFAAVSALMCATILRARLQPALTAASGVARIADGLATQGSINRVVDVWARLGVCSTDMSAGVRCSGKACACSCEVYPAEGHGAPATVSSSPSGGACALTAVGQ